ncbi:hypothetical protein MKW94_026719, partial [Papaver nudicaule]|nr:hypothetical protein [Papaver nudicaule]
MSRTLIHVQSFWCLRQPKILSPVLDMAPFSFSIKLAALASGNEQINLQKWLSDYLTTYGNTFDEACLMFLKEILFDVPKMFLQIPFNTVVNAYLETVPIFIKALLGHAGQNISRHHLLEEMNNFFTVFIQSTILSPICPLVLLFVVFWMPCVNLLIL